MYKIEEVRFTSDTTNLQRLIQEFCKESSYKVTYDESRSTLSVLQRIADEDCIIFLANDSRDNVGGFIICLLDKSWHKETLGLIEKFYVAKDSRGTPLGRELFLAATKWFDTHNCVNSFITDTAGVHGDRRLINLAAKFGYAPCGTTLQRKYNGQV